MMKQYFFLFFLMISYSKIQSQRKESALPASKISEIRDFVKGKNYNQDLAVFINFKTHSGKYRYFVYDLKNNRILLKAIVSHGSGSVISKSDALKFSNTEGSYQSSLGRYEIREKYLGKYGKSYRLHGLDHDNSNAMKRAIVLHSFGCVPDRESDNSTCLSLGCPMLSERALLQTSKYLDSSKKPVILYAFY